MGTVDGSSRIDVVFDDGETAPRGALLRGDLWTGSVGASCLLGWARRRAALSGGASLRTGERTLRDATRSREIARDCSRRLTLRLLGDASGADFSRDTLFALRDKIAAGTATAATAATATAATATATATVAAASPAATIAAAAAAGASGGATGEGGEGVAKGCRLAARCGVLSTASLHTSGCEQVWSAPLRSPARLSAVRLFGS